MTLNALAARIHQQHKKWWQDPSTGNPIERNIGEVLALVHSEISEALEGHRKDLPDDHLPDYPMFDVELVDAMIRIFDLAGHRRIDLDSILSAKLAYNARRQDHKHEARLAAHGKRF